MKPDVKCPTSTAVQSVKADLAKNPYAPPGDRETYHIAMHFGGTALHVDEVSAVVDFYRRAFGLGLRFFDETLGFAELDTGGSTLAIAAQSLGEMLMPNRYVRPADGRPVDVEIAFLTRDVPASFAKAIAEGATPIAAALRLRMSGPQKVRSLASLNRPPRRNKLPNVAAD